MVLVLLQYDAVWCSMMQYDAVCTGAYATLTCNTCAHWRILQINSRGSAWMKLTSKSYLEGFYFDRPSRFCKLSGCCRVSIVLSCLTLTCIQLESNWIPFVSFCDLWLDRGVHTVRNIDWIFDAAAGFSMRSGQIPHLHGGWDGECDSTPSVANRNALDKVRQSLCSRLDSFKKSLGEDLSISFNHILKEWNGYYSYYPNPDGWRTLDVRCSFWMFSGFDTLFKVTIRGLKLSESPDNSQELSAWSRRS